MTLNYLYIEKKAIFVFQIDFSFLEPGFRENQADKNNTSQNHLDIAFRSSQRHTATVAIVRTAASDIKSRAL
jgi:hypothetical protein